jgi:hypothetical protein
MFDNGLTKVAAAILAGVLLVAGGRYTMDHRHHARPYTAPVNAVFAQVSPDGRTHYFLRVGDDFASTVDVEVSHGEFERARVGDPWTVK